MWKPVKFSIALVLLQLLTVTDLYSAEYIAYSLKVAEEQLKTFQGRHPSHELYYLGGITKVKGLVYDRERSDPIVVGLAEPDREPLTLDDLAVALRARFIHSDWPLVSIDPTPETRKTNMQHVRYEGGIRGTQFGQDMFDADLTLKKLGMDLIDPGIPGFESDWDIFTRQVRKKLAEYARGGQRPGAWEISERFWFYPVLPAVKTNAGVAAMEGFSISVFTEVMKAVIGGKEVKELATFHSPSGEEFCREVNKHFHELARVYPPFRRLEGLLELVGLANAIERMEERPPLDYWLKEYRVQEVDTPRQQEVLKREEEILVEERGVRVGSQHFIEGGVQLMVLAMRVREGNVVALRDAVLRARPDPDALSWGFIVGRWIIPTAPGSVKMEDIVPLFAQAIFLQRQKRYDDAITLYGKIIELKPDWDWPYNNRGVAYAEGLHQYQRAVEDFNRAIEIDPQYAEAYNNRGNAYDDLGKYQQAIEDYNRALEINPQDAEAYNNRGLAYGHLGQYQRAIEDYNRAIEINPQLAEAYNNRGVAYDDLGKYQQAIEDYNRALEINPQDAEAYTNRGAAYDDLGQHQRAIEDYSRAIEINPQLAQAYYNRGNAYQYLGQHERAIEDYSRAIEINPQYAEAYNNRGATYGHLGQHQRAIEDCSRAIEINPQYAPAYNNRGLAYQHLGQHERAIEDYNRAIEINPQLAQAYTNRAVAYYYLGQMDKACADVHRACELGDCKLLNFLRSNGLCR